MRVAVLRALKHHLDPDPEASRTDFWANQFRVLMTAAAYILMQELRLSLARTNSARAQVSTLRERFLKIGVQVATSVRRIVLAYRRLSRFEIPFLVWP
jgi:hypothetical protein